MAQKKSTEVAESVADATEPAVEEQAPKKLSGVVRFTNTNIDARVMRVADFEAHGITVDNDLVWNRENDFTVTDVPDSVAAFLGELPGFVAE